MITPLRMLGALSILATVTLATGCSESDEGDTTPASIGVTVELRPVALTGATTEARGLLPDEPADWNQFVTDLGLPDTGDTVDAAEWVAAANCLAEPFSTPDVAGACSTDGSSVFLLGASSLDESSIVSVEPTDADYPNDAVLVTLDSAGAAAFEELTGEVSGLQEPRNRVAIVVDGKVLSAPTVMSAISGGQVQIVGVVEDPSLEALVDAFS
ncbi:SecDF P1 head subdomain-containing protein [Demequina aurantiaca]|uniref:SecDF P1 head subdomain-containing protein n=1 Tax=Demequina aurantiaca TaxID=676200 RepID=UPI003D355250